MVRILGTKIFILFIFGEGRGRDRRWFNVHAAHLKDHGPDFTSQHFVLVFKISSMFFLSADIGNLPTEF